MRDVPLHVQVLIVLRDEVRERQRNLEARCGKGLEDRDYQRHVGRIAECAAVLENIQALMKGSLETVEDVEDRDRERRTTRRTAARDQRTQ